MSTTEPQKNISPQEIWDQLAQKFAHIADRLGMPIDPEIMETVIALNAVGIPTSMSCGGHLNERRGFVAPWVDICSDDPTIKALKDAALSMNREAHRIWREIEQLEKEQAQEDVIRARTEQRDAMFAQWHKQRRETRKLECPTRNILIRYLVAFYQDRPVSFDRRLILQVSIAGVGDTRLESQGAGDFYLDAPFEIQQQKLGEYRDEMDAFAAFLKSKLFLQST